MSDDSMSFFSGVPAPGHDHGDLFRIAGGDLHMTDDQSRPPDPVGAVLTHVTEAAANAIAGDAPPDSKEKNTFDDRFKYRIRFLVKGHRHDELFLSLEDAQQFAAKYVVEHGLRVRDLQIVDSVSNVRVWRSISKRTLKPKLSKPGLHLSPAGSVMLSRYLEIVHKADIDTVKVCHDGRIFVHDPTPEWPDRHRVVGNVDDMLRDFVKRWNEGVHRSFPKTDTVNEALQHLPATTSVNVSGLDYASDDG